MLLTAIFLVTCVITARVLQEKKMRVASVIYSILSVVLIVAILFTSDFVPVRYAFENLMGEEYYLNIKDAILHALYTSGYGTCTLFAFFITLFLQVVISVIYVVTIVVKLIKVGKEVYLLKKDSNSHSYIYRVLSLKKDINILYCRMLN